MRYTIRKRYLLKNEEAVSEEFTVLPAMSVVMMGLALFIILLAQTYMVYADRIDRLQRYQTADGFLQRFTNPDCFFIREGGLVNLSLLKKDNNTLRHFFDNYTKGGFCYLLLLQWDNQSLVFSEFMAPNPGNRIAMSKEIGIYLNEAQTIPGTLTILLWKGS